MSHSTQRRDDSTTPGDEIPALDAYPAGKNHEHLLLTGENNDTQWIMSSVHVDLMEER